MSAEPIQPILVLLDYRGGERFQRALDSLADAEPYFKRIVLSITAAPESDDMRRAKGYVDAMAARGTPSKAEIICTKVELPTMLHQRFWIEYLERTGARPDDWIYWLAYDDQVRVTGVRNLVDDVGNWPLQRGTAYFGPWAMRHEKADELWNGDPTAPLESWTSFPLEGPTEMPVVEWIANQLVQPTYMQMSGSVIAFESHQRLIRGWPKKRGPMRIEMATAATINNIHVAEFTEPVTIIYGRPNSDRASYARTARQEDVQLAAWLVRYAAHNVSVVPVMARSFAHTIVTMGRARLGAGLAVTERWAVRGVASP